MYCANIKLCDLSSSISHSGRGSNYHNMDVQRCRAYLAQRWGWVVTVASFFMHFVCFGIYYCFNITFIALQEEFQTSSTATSWVGSIAIGLSTMAGVFVTPLIYRFNNRAIALVGVITCFTSLMSTSLITVFPIIYLTYSVLFGVGSACASLSSMDLLLRYFPVTNCTRATMFTLIGSSTGMLCLAPLTYALIERWGWRIMLRIMGSLLLVIGVAALTVYDPPPPSSSTPLRSDEEETKGDLAAERGDSPTDGTREKSVTSDENTNPRAEPKAGRRPVSQERTNQGEVDSSQNKNGNREGTGEESKPLWRDKIVDGGKEKDAISSRDCGDVAVPMVTTENVLTDGAVAEVGDETALVTFWMKYRAIFYPDVWILGFCVMGIGVMNSFFYVNMGDFLLSVGFEKHVVPWVVTTLGISEMAGKLLLGVITDRLPFPKIFLYLIGCFTGIGCIFCLLLVRSVILLMILAIVIGLVVMTIADVLSYSICNQVFRKEDAVQTWTVVMVMQGVGFMVGAVFGESIDKTGSYNEAIYTSMGMYGVCALFCIAVPLYQRVFARDRMVMFEHQAECRRKITVASTTKAVVRAATATK